MRNNRWKNGNFWHKNHLFGQKESKNWKWNEMGKTEKTVLSLQFPLYNEPKYLPREALFLQLSCTKGVCFAQKWTCKNRQMKLKSIKISFIIELTTKCTSLQNSYHTKIKTSYAHSFLPSLICGDSSSSLKMTKTWSKIALFLFPF